MNLVQNVCKLFSSMRNPFFCQKLNHNSVGGHMEPCDAKIIDQCLCSQHNNTTFIQLRSNTQKLIEYIFDVNFSFGVKLQLLN